MVRGDPFAPKQGLAKYGPFASVRVKALLAAIVILALTITFTAMKPRPETVDTAALETVPEVVEAPTVVEETAAVAEPDSVPASAVASPPPQPEVSRAAASLLELKASVASTETSHLLRQPIQSSRLGQQHTDLPRLVTEVLGDFGYTVEKGDRLHAHLVASLANEKSDAYIDALLNSAISRGEFSPPVRLRLSSGRLDTRTLLSAMVRAARS